ncbi:hypothetical protein [Millisia brevis]|uniref:hypothetical protein n=1 Tax=Millisia brevis TaxID=264148 RepID=UPI001C3F410B|nr:hypothetical protein [Millisia brevis]
MEPNKCDEVRWFPLDALPDNTIAYVRFAILAALRDGRSFSEYGWRTAPSPPE